MGGKSGRQKFIMAFAAIYIVPFIVLMIGTFILSIVFGFTNADNAKKIEDNREQIKVAQPGITRKEIIDTALTLNGRIRYFWGGVSPPGWNAEWGKLKLVTADGDWSTGTYQPYGLDCAGCATRFLTSI